MAVQYEVTAIIREEGREKPRYVRMGSVIETKRGPMLKIESIPVGWNGWAYLNDPNSQRAVRQPQKSPAAPAAQARDEFTDEIPF